MMMEKKVILIIDVSKKRLWQTKHKFVISAIIETIRTMMQYRTQIVNKTCMVSVRLTNDSEIHKINFKYRGKNKPTNVLSFQTVNWNQNTMPFIPFEQLDISSMNKIYEISYESVNPLKNLQSNTSVLQFGDIVLSYDRITEEALEQHQDLNDYMKFITIHGILHLMGYDHEYENEAQEMESLEKLVMRSLKNQ